MFIQFFYTLRDRGVLHHRLPAPAEGAVDGARDLAGRFLHRRPCAAGEKRALLDLYDQVFLHHFRGVELKDPETHELTDIAKALAR